MIRPSVSVLVSCASSGLSFVLVPRQQSGKSNASRGRTVCARLCCSAPLRTTECTPPPSPFQSGWWLQGLVGGNFLLFCREPRRELCEGTETVCNFFETPVVMEQECSFFTLHGIRGGGATDLWIPFRDLPQLRRRGRWTSERTRERYVHHRCNTPRRSSRRKQAKCCAAVHSLIVSHLTDSRAF